MLQALPQDVLIQLLNFLWDDIVSVGRLASCHPIFHTSIMRAGEVNQAHRPRSGKVGEDHEKGCVMEESFWKPMYHWTWRHHNSDSINGAQSDMHSCYRREYQRRHLTDNRAVHLLSGMTKDLVDALRIHRSTSDNHEYDGNEDEETNDETTESLEWLDNSFHLVGRAWEHDDWNTLMSLRVDILDRMRRHAQRHLLSIRRHEEDMEHRHHVHSVSFENRLEGFLAARTFQRLHLMHSLFRWKELILSNSAAPDGPLSPMNTETSSNGNSDRSIGDESGEGEQRVDTCDHDDMILLEEFALLACEIQQTPADLLLPQQLAAPLHRNAYDFMSVDKLVKDQLDAFAIECRHHILEQLPRAKASSSSLLSLVEQQVQCINVVLFDRHKFQGDQGDYYNYRNSLLNHVLVSKKGNPITLAILYTCVCRRLWEQQESDFTDENGKAIPTKSPVINFQAYLVGLPGHVVVGVRPQILQEVASDSDMLFLDTFRGGEVLTLEACQHICHSYGVPWDMKYIQPMKSIMVFRRTLANLTNCHFREQQVRVMMQQHDENPESRRERERSLCPFHQELWFQQRALLLLHSQPTVIIPLLLDRLAQELPLTISPELLAFFGLLSPSSSMPISLPWSSRG